MISILMPLYNGAEFLYRSAASVISQTYSDWELLIGVNGLEEQECNRIIDKMNALHDDRIRVVSFSHKGKSKTLNELLAVSKYDVICLLDVDDRWVPQKLEKQLTYINDYDVVGSDCRYFGKKFGSPRIFLGKLTAPMFSFQNPVINSSVMMKKNGVHWEEEWEGLDDYNLWVNLLHQGKEFYNVPEILVYHRIHGKSYFNHSNEDLSQRLRRVKLTRLSVDECVGLESVINKREWQL